MLTEQEITQICRAYEITCPMCGTKTTHHRLKRDMARPTKTEGDGHPLGWKWGKSGFDSVDPKQFFMGVCGKCGFTGELDEADFRTSGEKADVYRKAFLDDAVQLLVSGSSSGKGAAQSLLKRLPDADPLGSVILKFHLGIFSQSLRSRISHGTIARYYLRIAWLYRDQETYYPDADLEPFTARLAKASSRWKKDLPKHKDYPVLPALALDETRALALARSYFERNYETLKEAKLEDELRLQVLLAEIGFRLYELTDAPEDFKKAASYFSGTMQRCLAIISDKSVVGGAVNRAREILEITGERGRELRALNKSRGGSGKAEDTAPDGQAPVRKKKKKAKVSDDESTGKAVKKKKARSGANGQQQPEKGTASPDSPKKIDGPLRSEDLETPADRDKAMRRFALLQEEVEALRTQVQELREDNKKWRQLIGKDALTGSPNKVALFRINLPKVIRSLGESGPFSCIAIGLDQVGKVNLEHGWLMGDRMLKASVKGLQKMVKEGEELYRIDGATFVLAGKMDTNAARQRAAEMRRALGGSTVKVEDTAIPLVSSLGVVTIERKVGDSDLEVANSVYEAMINELYKAKDKGGNTAEIHTVTRF